MTPDLSAEEVSAICALLKHTVAEDRYPLSPRIQTLGGILTKLDPSTIRPPNPHPVLKHYAPPVPCAPAGAAPAVRRAHMF